MITISLFVTGTRLGTMLQGVSTMVLGVGLAMVYSWKMTLVSLLSVPCVSYTVLSLPNKN